jgi:hypothetical protein
MLSHEQLIEKFNPENAAKGLSPEDQSIMQALTDAELKVLAQAYPNQPARKSYLVLYDKNVKPDQQLYALSTWQNLYNVRTTQQMKNLVPYNFRGGVSAGRAAKAQARRIPIAAPAAQRQVIDMTPKEAADELARAIQQPTNPVNENNERIAQELSEIPPQTPVPNPHGLAAHPTTTEDHLANTQTAPVIPAQPEAPKRGPDGKFASKPQAVTTDPNAPKDQQEQQIN